MKQGCIFLLIVLAAVSFTYFKLIEGTSVAEFWWIPLLFGIFTSIFVANIQGIFQAIRQIAASKKTQIEWKDGELVLVSGMLQASKQSLISPISGKSACIVEFEVYRYENVPNSKNKRANVAYRACLMVPCGIQNSRAQVSVVGFPLLTYIPTEDYQEEESYRRFASYIMTKQLKILSKSPLAAISELNSILKDDDGEVEAIFRDENFLDLSQFPSNAEDIEKLDPESNKQELENKITEIVSYLKSEGLLLRETIVPNSIEVTVFGTYNSQKRQINIGSGLSKIDHSIQIGSAAAVTSRNLSKALITTFVFGVILLVANYFFLNAIGIDPQSILQSEAFKSYSIP